MYPDKKILIWTIKGGCGKTSISAELILRLNYPAVTNEKGSMLTHIVHKDRLKILKDGEKIPNLDVGVIFDFGGYIDDRIKDAAKQSNFILIPTLPEASDIQGCINTIQAIKEFNKNIIIIANKTKGNGCLETVKSTVKNIGEYPVFELKESRSLPNIYLEKKSIGQMMKDKPLLKHAYKKINSQFDSLLEHLFKV